MPLGGYLILPSRFLHSCMQAQTHHKAHSTQQSVTRSHHTHAEMHETHPHTHEAGGQAASFVWSLKLSSILHAFCLLPLTDSAVLHDHLIVVRHATTTTALLLWLLLLLLLLLFGLLILLTVLTLRLGTGSTTTLSSWGFWAPSWRKGTRRVILLLALLLVRRHTLAVGGWQRGALRSGIRRSVSGPLLPSGRFFARSGSVGRLGCISGGGAIGDGCVLLLLLLLLLLSSDGGVSGGCGLRVGSWGGLAIHILIHHGVGVGVLLPHGHELKG
mmetsp:Transcript_19743/g.56647  ORF Transcript_19743/g.56647 Transcript_19743/m.56647 type:complete len:272 (-) Transcript_19743:469-1284(-)